MLRGGIAPSSFNLGCKYKGQLQVLVIAPSVKESPVPLNIRSLPMPIVAMETENISEFLQLQHSFNAADQLRVF